MNSYWYFTAAAQMRIIVACVMKAVRESIKTRTKIGAMANGMIYTLKKLCFMMSDTKIGNSVIIA